MNNDRQKKILEIIRNEMNSEERKQNDLSEETGASTWLTTLPVKEEGYILNKQFLGSAIYQIWLEIETNSKSFRMW